MDVNLQVQRAQQGDTEAFGLLYEEFVQRIFKYVRLKTQSHEEAEDLVQDVFVKAYRGLPGLRLEGLNFSAWLYKIAHNTVCDHFRKIYQSPKVSGMDEDFDIAGEVSVEKQAGLDWDMQAVRETFTRLRPIYKQVLELRFVQGLSLSEVAEILNKSNVSIRLIQFRALGKVRKLLKNYDVY